MTLGFRKRFEDWLSGEAEVLAGLAIPSHGKDEATADDRKATPINLSQRDALPGPPENVQCPEVRRAAADLQETLASLASLAALAEETGHSIPPPLSPAAYAARAQDWHDHFEERAAIIEHDGGYTRNEAERIALECFKPRSSPSA